MDGFIGGIGFGWNLWVWTATREKLNRADGTAAEITGLES
jgi:hypothetical protein